jgi:hypothetical protein
LTSVHLPGSAQTAAPWTSQSSSTRRPTHTGWPVPPSSAPSTLIQPATRYVTRGLSAPAQAVRLGGAARRENVPAAGPVFVRHVVDRLRGHLVGRLLLVHGQLRAVAHRRPAVEAGTQRAVLDQVHVEHDLLADISVRTRASEAMQQTEKGMACAAFEHTWVQAIVSSSDQRNE